MPPLSKSPRVSFLLNHLGLKDALDVIEHLPRRYEDYGLTGLPKYPENGERAVLFGKVVGTVKRPVRFKRASLTSFLFRLEDDGLIVGNLVIQAVKPQLSRPKM